MPRIVFDDEKAWPKIGQLISYCTNPVFSTGWILGIYLGRKSNEHRLVTCLVSRDGSFEILDSIHYNRLDTDLLHFDYHRLNQNPCNEIILNPTNNTVNVIQTT